MTLAVISDIHANDVALRTALYDAAQCGVDVYASLGDVVGYGPSPVESVRLARDSFSISLRGNHDAAVCCLRGISDFSDYAAETVRVQRKQLGLVEKTYLKLLPLVWHEGDVAMAHGDFTAPDEFRYVDDEHAAAANFAVRPERVIFIGHTHEPCVWMLEETGSVTRLPAANINLLPNRRYIINPGTVGYPRGGTDVCGTYVIYDDNANAVYFRNVPFDINAYSRALRAAGRSVERSKAADRVRRVIMAAAGTILGVVALGLLALLFQRMAYDKSKDNSAERRYVEVVTTNRVIQVIDKVTITNYVVEVWANGVKKSSRILDKPPVDFKEPPPPVTPSIPKPTPVVDKTPQTTVSEPISKPVIDEAKPYTVITPAQSLALGGAYGGDEVRIMKNANGTCDIVHIFTEPSKTKTFVVPKRNRIEPWTGRFLLVAGGGANLGFGGGDGGAGGVVEGNRITLAAGTSYIYVGNGGGKRGIGFNGEDSILTLCGKTYVAIGGGGGGGCSGGSGGTGGGRSGVSLQPISPSGGVGEAGDRNCGVKASISGEEKTYAVSGAYAHRFRLVCDQNSGYGEYRQNKYGFPGAGGMGIAIIRYTVRPPISKFTLDAAVATFPQPDAKVRSAVVNGITWRYFVENDTAVIGCHGEGSMDFPDLWLPAVDTNSLVGIVQIPARIAGMRVSKIGKGAFQGCGKVTRLVVPEGITHCGARAFAKCEQLELVVYPKSLKFLGEGQVFCSPNVKRLCFQSPPPASITGRCPFKGCGRLVKASIVVSASFVRQWRMDDGCLPDGFCKDGCHKIACLPWPSTNDMELANRMFAGFIGKEVSWKSVFSGGLKAAREHIVSEVEDVWRNYDFYSPKRRLSLPSLYVATHGIPKFTVKVYVSTMFFKAQEPVYFMYMIDDKAMVMIDNDIAVELSASGHIWHFESGKKPVVFDRDGWHRIAITVANGGGGGGATFCPHGPQARARAMLGGVYYRRGNDKNWRMFEATSDGKEFRVGPADARRAIADIERAKKQKPDEKRKK